VHEVNGRASGGQFSSDGAQDFERWFMEWEEMSKLFLSNGGRPGKATLVVEIIVIDGVRIDDFGATRSCMCSCKTSERRILPGILLPVPSPR
jgi:hypothetical protein